MAANFRDRGIPRGKAISNWVLSTTSPSGTDPCAPPSAFAAALREDPTMDADDPWNWDVDRLVRELCTQDRSWKPTAASRRIHDTAGLEKVLRDEEIDGSIFLREVTDEALKNDLGIKGFGQRAVIKQVIRELRRISPGYNEWRDSFSTGFDISVHGHRDGRPPAEVTLRPYSESLELMSPVTDDNRVENQLSNYVPRSSPEYEPQLDDVQSPTHERHLPPGSSPEPSSPIKKRPRLDEAGSHLDGDQLVEPLNGTTEAEPTLTHGDKQVEVAAEPFPSSETAVVPPDLVNGKKRKRIAPTLISSELVSPAAHRIPTFADTVIINDPDRIQSAETRDGKNGEKSATPFGNSTTNVTSTERPERSKSAEVHLGGEGTPVAPVVIPRSDEISQVIPKVKPGEVHVGRDGKKRMVPLSLSRPQETTQALPDLTSKPKDQVEQGNVADIMSKLQKTSSGSGYLGKAGFPVDNVFYQGAGIGDELKSDTEDDEGDGNFSRVTAGTLAPGRRLYIHKLMKKYLRTLPRAFARDGKAYLAVQPYSASLVPKPKEPSMTLISKSGSGPAVAIRANLQDWPEVDNATALKASNKPGDNNDCLVKFNLPINALLGGPNSYDTWNPEYLEKYNYIEGGDTVLPLYGESGSEGEYDFETWKEMHGDVPGNPFAREAGSSQRTPLTAEQVDAAIDESITVIREHWKTKRLPKLNAWKFWKRYPYTGQKSERHDRKRKVKENQQIIERIETERLPKMREEVHKLVWTSARQVRKQTRIMEQSIFDVEDLLWEVSILQMRVEPARQEEREAPAKPKEPRADAEVVDDDGEELESEEGMYSSSDETGDFIVADDEAESEAGMEDDLSMSMEIDSSPVMGQDEMDIEVENGIVGGEDDNDSVVQSNDTTTKSSTHAKPAKAVKNEKKVSISKPTALVPGMEEGEVAEVDLTTIPSSPGQPKPLVNKVIDLSDDSDGSPKAMRRRDPLIRRDNANVPFPDALSVDDDEQVLPPVIPALGDLAGIMARGRNYWERAGDRERFIIAQLASLSQEMRDGLADIFFARVTPRLWSDMVSIMEALKKNRGSLDGFTEKSFMFLTGVLRLFEMYIDCRYRGPRERLTQRIVTKILDKKDQFEDFVVLCNRTLDQLITDDQQEVKRPPRRQPRESITIESDDDHVINPATPKRKRKIVENVQARSARERDRQRLKEQDERRRVLQRRFQREQKSGNLVTDRARLIINDAKLEHQGFIYVHDHIKGRIKDHQIAGIRFMWSQVVMNEDMQGCLLAHTMGLGKTMQVITLLVAIAEAAKSPHDSVSSQIPVQLRETRVLVLCPPGLLNNWLDELLVWAPAGVLEPYRTVDSTSNSIPERLEEINSWYIEGGVLLIGYQLFQMMIDNDGSDAREPALLPEEHEQVKTQLLEGPNVIVADEAHVMKNPFAKITRAAKRFKSTSRIALTGSPLANNIEEYHTMIDWVAPGYLGPLNEFKAKYAEPIAQGMFEDSTNYDRRRALKMLNVLKEDIAPKVNRAGISVLRHDLQQKTEFVIKIPLTELQRKAYSTYVKFMLETPMDQRDVRAMNATVWAWYQALTLLCNHPKLFVDYISKDKDDKRNKNVPTLYETNNSGDSTPTVYDEEKLNVPEALLRQELEHFRSLPLAVDNVRQSYRTVLVEQILDLSKTAGDKVLIFSNSIATLDYLELMCKKKNRIYGRLDGGTNVDARQRLTKEFNTGELEVYLISMRAGGVGLNLFGANRVIIFDFKYNPVNEQQAIGRAYRIGQKKPVYVYRFVAGGTFEETVHNKTIYKEQLASRVVDRKSIMSMAKKDKREFLFEPKEVKQEDLSVYEGKDPAVLDQILMRQDQLQNIRSIVLTDTFSQDVDENLTAEEESEVKQMISEEQLKRTNPAAYHALKARQAREGEAQRAALAARHMPASQMPAAPGYLPHPFGGETAHPVIRTNEPPPILPNQPGASEPRPSQEGQSRAVPSVSFYQSSLNPPMAPMTFGMSPVAGAGTRMGSPFPDAEGRRLTETRILPASLARSASSAGSHGGSIDVPNPGSPQTSAPPALASVPSTQRTALSWHPPLPAPKPPPASQPIFGASTRIGSPLSGLVRSRPTTPTVALSRQASMGSEGTASAARGDQSNAAPMRSRPATPTVAANHQTSLASEGTASAHREDQTKEASEREAQLRDALNSIENEYSVHSVGDQDDSRATASPIEVSPENEALRKLLTEACQKEGLALDYVNKRMKVVRKELRSFPVEARGPKVLAFVAVLRDRPHMLTAFIRGEVKAKTFLHPGQDASKEKGGSFVPSDQFSSTSEDSNPEFSAVGKSKANHHNKVGDSDSLPSEEASPSRVPSGAKIMGFFQNVFGFNN